MAKIEAALSSTLQYFLQFYVEILHLVKNIGNYCILFQTIIVVYRGNITKKNIKLNITTKILFIETTWQFYSNPLPVFHSWLMKHLLLDTGLFLQLYSNVLSRLI